MSPQDSEIRLSIEGPCAASILLLAILGKVLTPIVVVARDALELRDTVLTLQHHGDDARGAVLHG